MSSTTWSLEVNSTRFAVRDVAEDERDTDEVAGAGCTARRGSPSLVFDEFFVAEDLGLPRVTLAGEGDPV